MQWELVGAGVCSLTDPESVSGTNDFVMGGVDLDVRAHAAGLRAPSAGDTAYGAFGPAGEDRVGDVVVSVAAQLRHGQ